MQLHSAIWLWVGIAQFLLLSAGVLGANFLIAHPFYSGSHVLTLHSVTQALIDKGHQVTTLRFVDGAGIHLRDAGPNHTDIALFIDNSDGAMPYTTVSSQGTFSLPMQYVWRQGLDILAILKAPENPWRTIDKYCEQLLGNKKLIEQLKSKHFDVAIVDIIYNECGLALATHDLGLPSVIYWAFSFAGGEPEMTTASINPSYVPQFMSRLPSEMSFLERVFNFSMSSFAKMIMWFHMWYTDRVLDRLGSYPGAADMLMNVSGALINTHLVLDYPRLQPETFINVGGMQISETPRQLPRDILNWIEGAEHGVVLFTMGFIFSPKVVPEERVTALLEAFSRLPQRVIMKFDNEGLEGVPPNVMIKSFVPQQDILAHPNVKVFFTHCGMHGVMEAIHHRVPMVGMPVFIDQGDILVRMEEQGIVFGIDKMANADTIYNAIVKVRDDESYQRSIDALSELMRLRRHHPMEDVVWLLEYVAATKGASHLKPMSRKLYFYQYICLDIIVFILLCTFIVYKLLFLTCAMSHRWRSKTRSQAQSIVKKKKN